MVSLFCFSGVVVEGKEVGMLVDILRGEVEELEAGFTDEFDLPFRLKVSPLSFPG